MPEHPDDDPRTASDGSFDGAADWLGLPLRPTAEEFALVAGLAERDRLDREAGLLEDWDDAVTDELAWEQAVVTDDELVSVSLGRGVHEADLMLLASIDPRNLSENLVRVDYLRALDRITARVASMRHAAVVAMVGERSSEAHLPEVAAEHEISVARRTSRYAAGRAIEVARALATTFPGFAAALRDGEVADAHCSILVERTRVVADERVLAEIERRVLPKARRLTPGEFAGEVAKTIARLDRDAAARVKKARATRRVWGRQLEDGMGYLGLTHDWSTIQAISDAVSTDGRCLQVARGGSGSVAEGNEDAAADACRADAMAARILGTVQADGSVLYDRENVAVTVNVVMDLPTLRGEADQIALVDGQPVPGEVGREVAQFATWWRRLVTDPVDGHLLDYGRTTYLPEKLRRFVLARDGVCRAPGCTTKAVSRLQMDHVHEFPEGPSTAENCGAVCTTCHQMKTTGFTDITDSHADGSCTWITAWGQSIHVPPRSVLPIEPDPPPVEPAPPTPEDPPPF